MQWSKEFVHVRRIASRLRRSIREARQYAQFILAENVKDALVCGETIPSRRKNSYARNLPKILMLDDLVPNPLFGAGYPRAFAIVQAFVLAGYDVTFYPMEATSIDLNLVRSMFAGVVRFLPAGGMRGLRRLLWKEGEEFDLVFVSRPAPMRMFTDTRWRPSKGHQLPKIIYDAEAVLAPREARRRALFGPAWSETEYRAALAAEFELGREVSAVTAVGRQDADMISSVLDVPVFVLSHKVAVQVKPPPHADRQDFLFVGWLHGSARESPNVDSVQWFASEVMPKLDVLIGTGYRLHLAGRTESSAITALASDRIVIHGLTQDLLPLYDSCRVFVAPTRYAAGIPLKVVEAMGAGLPCVVTPLLAAQLAVTDTALAIGGDAQEFADQCALLHGDPKRWREARDGGIAHVQRDFSAATFQRALGDVLRGVDARR